LTGGCGLDVMIVMLVGAKKKENCVLGNAKSSPAMKDTYVEVKKHDVSKESVPADPHSVY